MVSLAKSVYQPDFCLLVLEEEDGRVFTVDDVTLAVFSGEGEAEMFLFPGDREDGWKVRRTSPRELASLLIGPCVGLERVALDPSPEMAAKRLMGLVVMTRHLFLERFAGGGRGPGLPAALHVVPEMKAVC